MGNLASDTTISDSMRTRLTGLYGGVCEDYKRANERLKKAVRTHEGGYIEAQRTGFNQTAGKGYFRQANNFRGPNGLEFSATIREVQIAAEHVADYEQALSGYETTALPRFGVTPAPCQREERPLAQGTGPESQYARSEVQRVYQSLGQTEHDGQRGRRLPSWHDRSRPFVPGGGSLGGL